MSEGVKATSSLWIMAKEPLGIYGFRKHYYTVAVKKKKKKRFGRKTEEDEGNILKRLIGNVRMFIQLS